MRLFIILLISLFFLPGTKLSGQSSQREVDSCISALPAIKDPKEKIDAINSIAWDIAYLDFKKGIEWSLQAERLAKEIHYNQGLVKAYNTMGATYSDMGVYDEALKYFHQALAIANKDKKLRSFTGVVLFNLSRIYMFREDTKNAYKYTRQAYNILMERKDSSAMVMIGGTLAEIYSNMGMKDSADFYYQQCIDVARLINDPYKLGVAYMQIGLHYSKQEKYDIALAELGKAEVLFKKLDDGYDLFSIYSDYGDISVAVGNISKAIEHYNTAITLYGKNTTLSALADVHKQLGECYRKTGDFQKAFESQNTFVKLNDSINSEANKTQIQATEAKFLSERNQMELDKLKMTNQLQETVIEKQSMYNIFGIVGFSLLLIVAALIYRSYKIKKRDNHTITLQKQLVEEKNKEILDSITYAKRIQNAILPPPQKLQELLGENFVLYQPKDIVAGDFYWIDVVNSQIMFAVCDCTGHGVPGALVSVVCHNALNRSIREYGLTDPGKILDKTRELVVEQFQKTTDNVKDGMDVSLCVFNRSSGTITWSGANIPLWIARNNTQEIEELKPTKQPIGYIDEPKPFGASSITIEKGDVVYLLSDGYADQFGGDGGKKLKAANLKKMLLACRHLSMAQQRETLYHQLEKWKGSLEQVDDICVMGIRF